MLDTSKLIYAARDKFGLVQVIDTKTTRSLYFNSPVQQSCLYLQAPMKLSLEYQQVILERISAYSEQHEVSSTLMFGLGGGSLTNHLYCMYPNVVHTVVELRETVIYIAKEYFFLTDDSNVRVINQDAFSYLKQANPCSVFIIDLFDGAGMPKAFCQTEFLEDALALKEQSGLIIFNLWTSSAKDSLKIIKFWEKQGRFKIQIVQTQSSGNLILSIQ